MFAGCTAVVTCDEERAHSEEGEENDCNDDEVVLCEQLRFGDEIHSFPLDWFDYYKCKISEDGAPKLSFAPALRDSH